MLLEETLEDGTEVTITDESFTTHMQVRRDDDLTEAEAKEIALGHVHDKFNVASNTQVVAEERHPPVGNQYNVVVMMNR